ncbi:MAG TPA: hypothetical protein VGB17_11910 [Pyrinomonadaceae bacterium]|jgi:hypothetical protein
MGKRNRRFQRAAGSSSGNPHFENLVKLREGNPQAYERLSEETHQTVERYQMSQLAKTFEYNPGNESLLELSERRPEVFALLNQRIREEVEQYAASRRAHKVVQEEQAAPENGT